MFWEQYHKKYGYSNRKDQMADFKTRAGIILFVWLGYLALWLTVAGCLAYTAWHFIHKYW